MADLLGALGALGIRHDALGIPGHLPVRIHGAPITSREWRVPAGVSSQFTSALCLLAAQQPADQGPIRIALEGRQVSVPYVDMTLALLEAQGIRAAREGTGAIRVHPAPAAHALIQVELDASALAYFLAAAAVTGTAVEADGIGAGSLQGDVVLARAFERMGCRLALGRDSISLRGGPLQGIEIDMGSMPDAALTLAAVAALARGPTRITNVAHLRLKECDRIRAARLALESLGARADEGPDWLAIHPSGRLWPAGLRTVDDHRVAMAFPGFWDELERFRAHHRGR
jgi:3-phosphoshikimate 1-carboxyvinyltransferase